MPDRHALLGPSSAGRWLACPPSARLNEKIPDVTSPFAEEGTRAHTLCELKLKKFLGLIDKVEVDFEHDEEMDACTDDYADFVEEELNAVRATNPDAKLMIETELDYGDYVPEGFGTSDAVIVSDHLLEVIDFKYGRGVTVDPKSNPQLRLYALGAYLALGGLYDFTEVKTVIFQPRVSNVGSDTITVKELLDWADSYVKPRAKLAFAGKGDFCVGAHCRFCKAGGTCRARAEEAFKIVDMADTSPVMIDDSEIPAILDKLDNAEKWIAAIRRYAEDRAICQGKHWKGYKLVESRTVRKISDPFKALDALNSAGYSSEDVTTVKLKGLSELEKLLGHDAFADLLGPLIVKPKGTPTLVKESDKRPEISTIEEMFKEET